MRTLRWSAAVMGAAYLLSNEVAAQTAQRISVQVSGLYESVSGDGYSGLDAGPGFEGQLRLTRGPLSFGAGFQYTRHDAEDFDENVKLYGGFIEPRCVIATSSNFFAPYLSARLSILRQRFANRDVRASAIGASPGVGNGVLLRVSSHLNLDLGASYAYTKFGDIEVVAESDGATLTRASGGSGLNLAVHVGLTVGLGR